MAENDLFKGFIHDMLGLTGKLLGTDGDDERIIDYLGLVASEMFGHDLAQVIQQAYSKVVAQATQHAQALATDPNNPENKKLADRYAKLKYYFDFNIHRWSKTPATK